MGKVRIKKEQVSVDVRPPLVKITITLGVCVIMTVCALYFALTHAFVIVNGESMMPTLKSGEFTFASSGFSLERGGIYVLRCPDTGTQVVKRLVALPGDEIEFISGELYVNGGYSPWQGGGETESFDTFRHVLGMDEYYFCGDNRGNSLDSRYWSTPAKLSDIKFRVHYVLFPFMSFRAVR